jgi:hypothetical protein
MKVRHKRSAQRVVLTAVAIVGAALALAATASATPTRWVSGDINTHTFLGDGKNAQGEVLRNAFANYGLDYVANADPGGTSANNPQGIAFVAPVARWLTLSIYSYPIIQDARVLYPERSIIQGLGWNAPGHDQVSVGIVGAANEPSGISNFEYRFDAKDTDTSRASEGTKAITHSETFSTAIAPTGATEAGNTVTITTLDFHHLAVGDNVAIAGVDLDGYNGTFTVASVTGMSFTYTNPTADLAPSGNGSVGHTVTITDVDAVAFDKVNATAADTNSALQWLDDNYSTQAYAIIDHPSRSQLWHVGDIRALNDAAPDVVFGMEGMPGHQASIARGNYNVAYPDPAVQAQARTYGGADYMTAKVGGLWDSLLGEGRHFWIFNNSDYVRYQNQYKDAAGNYYDTQYYDFWPGQYARTWTNVSKLTPQSVVNGMRSGNAWVVNGDLINALKFTAADTAHSATMGQTLHTKVGKVVKVTISVRSPKVNEDGDPVKVNHVDVIAGNVTARLAQSADPAAPYNAQDTNASTKVIKTFKKVPVVKGWMTMSFTVKATKSMYFRLRGTNLAANTPNETDTKGNPLNDELSYIDFPNPDPSTVTVTPTLHGNQPAIAWKDLWFYSNPVFVSVK